MFALEAHMIPARRRGIAVAALFLSLLLVAPNLFADTGSAPRSPEAQVDALFSGIAGKEAPGASVLVIQSGRVMLSKSYGFANLEHRVPNAPETKFRLASVTKPFTAIAILQLREAGRLDLDAPIGRYLPNVPHGDRITVRHLLNHTSGLGNSGSDPLQFSPGERVNYTNEGYRLLGRIVESVSGGSWEEYLKEHILVPLAMTSTGCDHPEQVLSHRASGYVFDAKGGYLNEPSEDIFKTAWAAGALYSTVEDLARLDQALVSGTLLKPATLAQAFAPTTLADGTQAPVGLGWMVAMQRGLREVSHGGDASGFNAWFGRYSDQQFTVIVLSNVCMRPQGPLPSALSLGRRIAAIYLGDQMQPETVSAEYALTPAQMQAFVGRYRLEGKPEVVEVGGGVLNIGVEGGRLVAWDKVNRMELRAESAEVLRAREDDTIALHFTRDDQGKAIGFIAHVMGVVEIRGTKLQE
jgi:CubicO group peptidase (beta-lactamase class C family)